MKAVPCEADVLLLLSVAHALTATPTLYCEKNILRLGIKCRYVACIYGVQGKKSRGSPASCQSGMEKGLYRFKKDGSLLNLTLEVQTTEGKISGICKSRNRVDNFTWIFPSSAELSVSHTMQYLLSQNDTDTKSCLITKANITTLKSYGESHIALSRKKTDPAFIACIVSKKYSAHPGTLYGVAISKIKVETKREPTATKSVSGASQTSTKENSWTTTINILKTISVQSTASADVSPKLKTQNFHHASFSPSSRISTAPKQTTVNVNASPRSTVHTLGATPSDVVNSKHAISKITKDETKRATTLAQSLTSASPTSTKKGSQKTSINIPNTVTVQPTANADVSPILKTQNFRTASYISSSRISTTSNQPTVNVYVSPNLMDNTDPDLKIEGNKTYFNTSTSTKEIVTTQSSEAKYTYPSSSSPPSPSSSLQFNFTTYKVAIAHVARIEAIAAKLGKIPFGNSSGHRRNVTVSYIKRAFNIAEEAIKTSSGAKKQVRVLKALRSCLLNGVKHLGSHWDIKTDSNKLAGTVFKRRVKNLGGSIVRLPGNAKTTYISIRRVSATFNVTDFIVVALYAQMDGRSKSSHKDLFLRSGILQFGVFTNEHKKLSVSLCYTIGNVSMSTNQHSSCGSEDTFHQADTMLCRFWDEKIVGWSSKGCDEYGTITDDMGVRCCCNHTTNYAVLSQVVNKTICGKHLAALSIISYIGCCISVGALTTMLFLHAYLRRTLWSDRTAIHVFLTGTLLVAQVVFLAGIKATGTPGVCRFVAIFLHFSYTAVFSWSLMEGLHLYFKVVQVYGTERSKLRFYVPAGFGLPAIVVAITVAVDFDGYGNTQSCWLSQVTNGGTILAFIVPAAVIIFINICILLKVLQIVVKSTVSVSTGQAHLHGIRAAAKAAIFLLPILGVWWLFGMFAVDERSMVVFQYLFVIFNSSQGFFIFLFHFVFNSEARQAFRRKQQKQKAKDPSGSFAMGRSLATFSWRTRGSTGFLD